MRIKPSSTTRIQPMARRHLLLLRTPRVVAADDRHRRTLDPVDEVVSPTAIIGRVINHVAGLATRRSIRHRLQQQQTAGARRSGRSIDCAPSSEASRLPYMRLRRRNAHAFAQRAWNGDGLGLVFHIDDTSERIDFGEWVNRMSYEHCQPLSASLDRSSRYLLARCPTSAASHPSADVEGWAATFGASPVWFR